MDSLEFSYALVLRALGALAALGLAKFFYRLHQVRMLVRDVSRKHGVPILPHSYLLGHLPVVAKLTMKYPSDVFGGLVPHLLAKEYPEMAKHGLFYMDMWPITAPMLSVYHPDMMTQFCQDTSLPKAELLHYEFQPFTQCRDLLNLEGAEWKKWRSIFNPGFSARNIISLMPAFLEEIHVFTDHLKEAARTGEIIKMEDPAMKLTIDVIGRAVLGTRLHSQTKPSPFYEAMHRQVGWLIVDMTPPSILKLLNPLRPLIMWNNNRIMRNYLMPFIQQGITDYARSRGEEAGPKTINSLATKAYLNEFKPTSPSGGGGGGGAHVIDSHFIDMALSQLKIFIFAGHDTTATTLSFAYHLLYKNPDKLAILRAEHDDVFGPDPTTAEGQLSSNPQLLNSLPYTQAVIKETLRMFPPVGSVREGQRGFFLTHPDTKTRYPTEGWMLFSNSFSMQRSEEIWPRADEFLPERWLNNTTTATPEDNGSGLRSRYKNAYRPFELGPRNCIGQELAQLEMRAILVLTVRELDVESAYPDNAPELFGDKAYQVMVPKQITGHPKDGMPVRVRVRKTT
ncbi:cytochrome P450 [Diplogelasinospora grovesii]|uniref:Cytochrome P450 n=1 Tax=Diplogelasinospora grovesii TaxID=303347 RepID=A0AAN6N7W5_9PEZI|nr:cytochrome P450 [Diplogelasinospora grovesii]